MRKTVLLTVILIAVWIIACVNQQQPAGGNNTVKSNNPNRFINVYSQRGTLGARP